MANLKKNGRIIAKVRLSNFEFISELLALGYELSKVSNSN